VSVLRVCIFVTGGGSPACTAYVCTCEEERFRESDPTTTAGWLILFALGRQLITHGYARRATPSRLFSARSSSLTQRGSRSVLLVGDTPKCRGAQTCLHARLVYHMLPCFYSVLWIAAACEISQAKPQPPTACMLATCPVYSQALTATPHRQAHSRPR
jgi:hypothetical protein